jgi:KaiC/GvpD/RAD55 family RecA-like ATPase
MSFELSFPPSHNVHVDGLDEAFHGKLQPRQNALLVGPPLIGKTTLGLQFIVSGLRENETGIIISTSETADGIKRRALQFGWDLSPYEKAGELKFIDCYSKIIGLPSPNSDSTYVAGQDECDLQRLSVILSALVSDYWQSGSKIRVLMDNLSSLFLYSDLLTVSRFLHVMLGRLKSVGATSILIMESGVHDEKTMTTIRALCDGVILLSNDGETRYLNGTLGMGAFNKVPLRLTAKGLAV